MNTQIDINELTKELLEQNLTLSESLIGFARAGHGSKFLCVEISFPFVNINYVVKKNNKEVFKNQNLELAVKFYNEN
jgi:hypothetical protein